MQLEAAENTDEIRSIFDSARLYDDGHRKKVREEIKADITEETLSRIVVRAPDVTINVEPTPVTVNVEQAKNYYTPPAVVIPEIKVPKIEMPKYEERKAVHKKVKRDAQTGKITDIIEVEE
jgi:hypothetical protein